MVVEQCKLNVASAVPWQTDTHQQYDYAYRCRSNWTHFPDVHHPENNMFQFPMRISPQMDMCIVFLYMDMHSRLPPQRSTHFSAVILWSSRANDCRRGRSSLYIAHCRRDHLRMVRWSEFLHRCQLHCSLRDSFSIIRIRYSINWTR